MTPLVILGLLAVPIPISDPDRSTNMEITRKADMKTIEGPADWFTGKVTITGMFQRPDPSRVGGAIVHFEPDARTAWHTHPAGQTLTSNQMIDWSRTDLAKTLGIPKEKVRLQSPYVGGGFGGKLFLRTDAVMAALGAKAAGRPVKVALPARSLPTTPRIAPPRGSASGWVPCRTAPSRQSRTKADRAISRTAVPKWRSARRGCSMPAQTA
jgi:Molybdopterin-binding domain of aldehyde dehydrogenase